MLPVKTWAATARRLSALFLAWTRRRHRHCGRNSIPTDTRVATGKSFKRSSSGVCANLKLGSQSGALRCPIAASTRNAIFCALSFEVTRRLRELRPVDIVKGIDVHDRISSALDHTRHDRNNSARLTHMEIGRLCSESVLARLGRIGN